MDRRAFLGMTGGLLTAPLAAVAQQTNKVHRLGWLGPDPTFQRREWLVQDLRDLGYVDGRNVEIAYRFAKGHIDRLTAIVAELVALRVDVIVAVSQPAVQAAQQVPGAFPSSCSASAIRYRPGSFQISLDRGATSRASASFRQS